MKNKMDEKMEKALERLRVEYRSIPIPKELEDVVNQALSQKPKTRHSNKIWMIAGSIAASILLVACLNLSPVLAASLSDIPVIGKLIEVFTFTERESTTGDTNIKIKTPAIKGLDNQELAESLNSKYLEESKLLYEEFMETTKDNSHNHISLYSGYDVLTDNEIILSLRRYTEVSQASTERVSQYDTIDKENEVLLSLKSLFKDASYVDVISQEIKRQMSEQMEADENKHYWLNDPMAENFIKIKADQNFYINKKKQLVIAFDKYEVAPGYMGEVEFVIPTSSIASILVGDRYIK